MIPEDAYGPQEVVVHHKIRCRGVYREQACGKLLAEFIVGGTWRIKCARCKTVNEGWRDTMISAT